MGTCVSAMTEEPRFVESANDAGHPDLRPLDVPRVDDLSEPWPASSSDDDFVVEWQLPPSAHELVRR